MKVREIIELVHKAQEGYDEAFLKLFQAFENDMYRMAFLYVKNKHDALDVVQETAYRSFKKISTLNNPEYLKSWLIKITISCATDLLRKNKKVTYLNPEHAEFIGVNDGDLPLALSLQDLIDSLNEKEKNLVFLKYYYGYTFDEISELVGTPSGSVKSVIYRALAKLRKRVRRVDMYE